MAGMYANRSLFSDFWWEFLEDMSMEQRGQFLTACYSAAGVAEKYTPTDPAVKLVSKAPCREIKEARANYEIRCKTNRQNGAKRSNCKRTQANADERSLNKEVSKERNNELFLSLPYGKERMSADTAPDGAAQQTKDTRTAAEKEADPNYRGFIGPDD